MFEFLKRWFGQDGETHLDPIVELLGISLRIDPEEAKPYIPNAVATLLGEWDPERQVRVSIDYHPDYRNFALAGEVYSAESPIKDSPVCLVVEDKQTGRLNTYGLFKVYAGPLVSVPRLAKTRNGWFCPNNSGKGSPELHNWLRERVEAGGIPDWFAYVMGICPIHRRAYTSQTLHWLGTLYFGVSTVDRIKILDCIQYLLELYKLQAQTDDPWSVCVGWSVRLSGYSMHRQVQGHN